MVVKKDNKPGRKDNHASSKTPNNPSHVRNLFSTSRKRKHDAFQPWTETRCKDEAPVPNDEEDDLISDVCSIFNKQYSPKKKRAIKNWVMRWNVR